MSRSLVRVWNTALRWCRAEPVTSTSEDTASARACRRYWDDSRDAVLRAYPWNAAAARAPLAEVAPAPPFGFSRRYRLPNDCLTVRAIWGHDNERYVVEGRDLLCDIAAPLPLIYTARVDDAAAYDPLLAQALSARLAYDMAPSLIESNGATEALFGRYRTALQEARAADAAEGRAPEDDVAYSWIEARR